MVPHFLTSVNPRIRKITHMENGMPTFASHANVPKQMLKQLH